MGRRMPPRRQRIHSEEVSQVMDERNQKAAARARVRYQTDPAYREKTLARIRAYKVQRRRTPEYCQKQLEAQRLRLKTDPVYREKRNAQQRAHQRALRGWTMQELAVEKYLCAMVEERGGFCPKFLDPGRRGAPDRLVIMKGHPTYFVELKRPKLGYLEPHQKRYHERLRECGQKVWVLSSIEQVDEFIQGLMP